MEKGTELSMDMRKLIIKLRNEGKTMREIGTIIGKSHTTIQRVINNFRERGHVRTKPRSGRPKALSVREERVVIQQVKKDPTLSAPKIKAIISETLNKDISSRTVQNVLTRAGYRGCVARKKPFISKVNRQKRLAFAKEYLSKSQEFWNKVIFTDESKYNVWGADGRKRVWRKKNTELETRNLRATVKHGGGSVMVWGAMAASGAGELQFIETTMDRFGYLDILQQKLHASAQKLDLGQNFIFQHDCDPKHTAKIVKEWLLYHVPHQLHTPPQSPDLNPIEHLWELLERRIRQYDITSKPILKQKLLEEWENITAADTSKLVHSMHRRLQEVISHKGGPTRY